MSNVFKTVKVVFIRCQRCGHEWLPRKPASDVRMCPKCKSPYWDTPKKKKEK